MSFLRFWALFLIYNSTILLHMSFSIYFFGFVGSAKGVIRVECFPSIFMTLIFILLLVSGLIGVVQSFVDGKNSKKLTFLVGILAIASFPLFVLAYELTMSGTHTTRVSARWRCFPGKRFWSKRVLSHNFTRTANMNSFGCRRLAEFLPFYQPKYKPGIEIARHRIELDSNAFWK